MTKDISSPAFPQFISDKDGMYLRGGMTLRDYFAAKAMQAMVQAWIIRNIYPTTDFEVASNAYRMAEAMLQERSKS